MASVNLPRTPWFATSGLTSDEMRYALAALLAAPAGASIGSETGVFPSVGGLAVTVVNATTVSVAPGPCAVQAPVGGTYVVTVDAATAVGVTAQASNSRIDLVCVRVLDSEAGDGLGQTIQARILTVEGTAAASPSVPATPNGYLVLAQLSVNSSGITVTDRRQFTRAAGGARLASSVDTRNGAYPGDHRTWPDGRIDVWNGTEWVTAAAPAAWSSFPATLSYAGSAGDPAGTVNLGAGGLVTAKYMRAGKRLDISYTFVFGGAGLSGGSGSITTTLPPGMVARSTSETHIHAYLFTGGTTTIGFVGDGYVVAGESVIQPRFPQSRTDCSIGNYRIAASPGTPGAGIPNTGPGTYPGGSGSVLTLNGTIELA